MAKIIELSDMIINQIAAGEVIERPAYIVKELVDNALDAGATRITILLEGYGLDRIEIRDDGEGMAKEDVFLSFLRHTTSKLRSVDDLIHIRSLGFRGEALASIAAVATITIASRPASSHAGMQVTVKEGIVQEKKTVSMPSGTTIIVQEIFSSVPARQKFLKSAQTEYRLFLSVLEQFVLSYPQIRWELIHNRKRTLWYPAVQDIARRIKAVFSPDIFVSLLPLAHEHDYLTIHGYASMPQLSAASRFHQYFFLNRRAITDPLIASAIKDAYGTLLAPHEYPYILLYLQIPHHLIDVNVHPRKETVRFVDATMVYEAVHDVVTDALARSDLRFIDRRWHKSAPLPVRESTMSSYGARELRKTVHKEPEDFSKINDILQLHNLYIIVPVKQGLVVIDQHAAHERVLYERLMKSYQSEQEKKELHYFDKPVFISLSPEEGTVLKEYQEMVNKYGIEYILTDTHAEVTAVLKLLKDRPVGSLLRGLIDMLGQEGVRHTMDMTTHRIITYLACRSAIKAGDPLLKKQMRNLLAELKAVQNPYTCPHGRPIQLVIDLDHLHRLFKRK